MSTRIISFFLSIVALFSGFTFSNDSDAIRYRDMPYGINYKRQTFDLNIPKSVKGNANMILYIHGGTWCGGDKDDYETSVENISKKEIVSGAINYRFCSPLDSASVEDILDDITSALEKIKETAAENGVNIKGVMFNGMSAGAHLSLLYAYSRYDEAPIKPVAVVAKSPVTDFTDMTLYDGSLHEIDTEKWYIPKKEWCQHLTYMTGRIITQSNLEKRTEDLYNISPIKYVTKKSVPTIIVHGTKDTVLPYANSVALNKKLKKCGVEHEFITYKGAWHNLQNCPEGTKEYNKAYSKYIEKYVKKSTNK